MSPGRGGVWPHVGLAAVAIAAAAVLADPPPRVDAAFRFGDPDITESSALVLQDGLALTLNDSGGDPVVYAVDPASGKTVGRTTYSAEGVEDTEALAVGPDGTVWVGDIGDNGADRDSIALYALPPVGRGDSTVDAPRYDLAYPDGPRDAETLLADPRDGRLYVVSKGLFGGAVYAVPRRLRTAGVNRLRKVATVDGLLTDGTFTADGNHALLRGYGTLYVADTSSWRYVAQMGLPDQRQGEGLSLGDDPEHVLLSTEGARTEVLRVRLSAAVQRALDGRAADRTRAGSRRDGGSAGSNPRAAAADAGPSVPSVVGLAAAGAAAVVAVGLVVRAGRRRSRSRR